MFEKLAEEADKYFKLCIADKDFEKRLGLCYEINGRYARENPDTVLVHGKIRGSGNDKSINHAWVENKEGTKVYDAVIGRWYPQWLYYEQFNAEPEKKYVFPKSVSLPLKHKHWGPWH